MYALVKKLNEITLADLPEVGGKNASLGEMTTGLKKEGIPVPEGFATTAFAFKTFLDFEENHLSDDLAGLMKQLNKEDYSNLHDLGEKCRKLIMDATLPLDLTKAIEDAYNVLGNGNAIPVAVRSSATAEDLPQASFAGQHESYLNIKGKEEVVKAVHKCYASLYTDRAIKYREDNGFYHEKVLLSVGVQKMVRTDKACSGVAFTLEPDSGFRDVIHISGVWGLGENLVQGTVNPDEFIVFKPTLIRGKQAIIQHRLGDKLKTMVFAENDDAQPVVNIDTPVQKQVEYVLSDEEIKQIANWCLKIEEHYAKPMDIEWAKDGDKGELFILQARPETVQSRKNPLILEEYQLLEEGNVLTTGQAVGYKITSGKARLLASPKEGDKLQAGDILVTDLTSPDWDPILKRAAAIVTNKGGRTSHASIVARELGVPAVVGCNNATEVIKEWQLITVSCSEGKTGNIYEGKARYEIIKKDFSSVRKPLHTAVMLIVGDPGKAFKYSFYPNDGVGLMRLEFIITHFVQVHPMALLKFHELKDARDKELIEKITHPYTDKKKYFIEKLSEGIATIAAAFYPKEVIVRTSDFKSNEYSNLIGGMQFEPVEENPMLGFRGASRYYHPLYKEGFAMECEAIRKVRNDMGLTNVKVMIPFIRTVEEAEKVIQVMAENGLDRRMDESLKFIMMAEIPSNVLLAEQFGKLFDGFSIGSNDLTQLTLGVDRDSAIVSSLFTEKNDAAKMMMGMVIDKAVKAGVKIGLCGQAPSDDPDFASFLVHRGISSISFSPDSLFKGIENINMAEEKLRELEKRELLTEIL